MSFEVTLRELYAALPVINIISAANLSTIGAMRLTNLVVTVSGYINMAESNRSNMLTEYILIDEETKQPITKETVKEDGTKRKEFEFKSPEAFEEMAKLWEEELNKLKTIPYKIKPKHLVNDRPGGGYDLTVQDCIKLGRLLSYDDLTKEEYG